MFVLILFIIFIGVIFQNLCHKFRKIIFIFVRYYAVLHNDGSQNEIKYQKL